MTLKIQGNSVPTLILKDVWHYRAIGPRAETIYYLLLDYEERHIDELVDRIQVNKRIIENALTKLYKNGLVEPLGSGFYLGVQMTEVKAIEIAKKYGTYGKSHRRMECHREERQRFLSYKMLRQKSYWMKRYGKYTHKG